MARVTADEMVSGLPSGRFSWRLSASYRYSSVSLPNLIRYSQNLPNGWSLEHDEDLADLAAVGNEGGAIGIGVFSLEPAQRDAADLGVRVAFDSFVGGAEVDEIRPEDPQWYEGGKLPSVNARTTQHTDAALRHQQEHRPTRQLDKPR